MCVLMDLHNHPPPSLSPSVHQDNETCYGPASIGISCSCASPTNSSRLHLDESPDDVFRWPSSPA